MSYPQSNRRYNFIQSLTVSLIMAITMLLIPISSASGKSGEKDTKVHPLSTYRFLVGGSWVHSDESPTGGVATAALFMRTRLYDARGKLDTTNMDIASSMDGERWFLDLMVDAHFITNRAYNEVTWTESNEVASVFLAETRSSKVSMALYLVPKIFEPINFADYGVVGLFTRFTVSTQEGSIDIFRRFVFGVRLENRSIFSIRGASAEVGFTVDNAPGSLQKDKNKIGGIERIVLNFELPISGKSGHGLYAQFHAEWPIAHRVQLTLEDGTKKDASPPNFEFRLGMTFDPARMFGFLIN